MCNHVERINDFGYGTQVSSERADGLDNEAIKFLRMLVAQGVSGRRPIVLDVGCGSGSQSVRLASEGGDVFSIDCEDFGDHMHAAATAVGLDDKNPNFIKADAKQLQCLSALAGQSFDLVYCQRMLHYLRYNEAVRMLSRIGHQMVCGGRLFLGISGMSSELAVSYKHRRLPISDRFCQIDKDQQEKHRICKKVCLYTMEEAVALVQSQGFMVSRAWLSDFGNVKLVASKGP